MIFEAVDDAPVITRLSATVPVAEMKILCVLDSPGVPDAIKQFAPVAGVFARTIIPEKTVQVPLMSPEIDPSPPTTSFVVLAVPTTSNVVLGAFVAMPIRSVLPSRKNRLASAAPSIRTSKSFALESLNVSAPPSTLSELDIVTAPVNVDAPVTVSDPPVLRLVLADVAPYVMRTTSKNDSAVAMPTPDILRVSKSFPIQNGGKFSFEK